MRVQVYEWLVSSLESYMLINSQTNNFETLIRCKDFNETHTTTTHPRIVHSLGCEVMLYWDNLKLPIFVVNQKYPGIPYNGDCLVSKNGGDLKIYDNIFSVPNNINIEKILGSSTLNSADVLLCAYFKTDTLHLKPCKLLAPYGSHPIGECCMINILDNTLYFNDGSGSFSVEGEAGEVIDTTPCYNNIISKESTKAVRLREYLTSSSSSATLFIKGQDIKSVSAKILCGSSTGTVGALNVLFIGQNGARLGFNIWQDYWDVRATSTSIGGGYAVDMTAEIEVDADGNYLIRKNEEIYRQGNVSPTPDKWVQSEYITIRNGDRVYYIKTNEHNLYPCELALPFGTHPIGEACMINLLNGDLYFNQGSGQFSCEGAVLGYWQDKPLTDHYCDVEGTLHKSVQIFADNGERLKLIWEKNLPWSEHRWLTFDFDYSSTLNVFPELPIGQSVKFSMVGYSYNAGILGLRQDDGRGWDSTNVATLQISGNQYRMYKRGDWGRQIDFNVDPWLLHNVEVKGRDCTIDGVTLQFPSNEPILFAFIVPRNQFFRGQISKVEAENFHLTPSILNRPTLASEDNNGIARRKGEAVLVDKERYKRGLPWVFGNIANSGSFSVSDYLIEGEDYEVISGVVTDSDAFVSQKTDAEGKVNISFSSTNENSYVFKNVESLSATYKSYVKFESGKLSVYQTSQKENIVGDIILANGIRIDAKFFKLGYNSGLITQGDSIAYTHYAAFESNRIIDVGDSDVIVYSFSNDNYNLIPVRLKKPIEPYCTHNGKDGKVGEIGFFDKVSGRFFGNDGSGEFSEYIPE